MKGYNMQEKDIENIVQNIKETMKTFDLKDGDMFSILDEHHSVRVSPYRLTMELRFPEGINNATAD